MSFKFSINCHKRLLGNSTKLLIIFFICIKSSFSIAVEASSKTDEIKNIVNNLDIPTGKIGISVRQTNDGEEIVSINSDTMLNPASNIKILTSYCALKNLGVNYHWETSVFTKSNVKEETIDGDIFVRGNGDPYLVSESLWMLTKELLDQGIKRVTGNVILDSKFFKVNEEFSDFENDYDRSFTAISSALALNFNSVTIFVHPETVGKVPTVITDPALDYFVIENKAVTISTSKRANPKISVEPLKDKTKIKIYGTWSKTSKRVHYRKVFHPEIYYGSTFKKFFTDQGGKIDGVIKAGTVPEDAKTIVTFQSRPLSQCIYGMNKFSSNFMATQILLTLGSKEGGMSATLEKGLKTINECFDSLGIRKDGNVIKSASGLSRDTKISPAQITSILVKAERDFQISPEFIASLGIYGYDGTVRKRDFPDELTGVVRVKTGNLEDVDAISGYVKTKNSNLLAFSIIANDISEFKRPKYRQFQENLIFHIFNNF